MEITCFRFGNYCDKSLHSQDISNHCIQLKLKTVNLVEKFQGYAITYVCLDVCVLLPVSVCSMVSGIKICSFKKADVAAMGTYFSLDRQQLCFILRICVISRRRKTTPDLDDIGSRLVFFAVPKTRCLNTLLQTKSIFTILFSHDHINLTIYLPIINRFKK